MSADIIVAVVSGIAGLLGAAFAWFQAIRTTRVKADSELLIEQLRLETERRRKAFELATAESAPVAEAITEAWHDIQIIKDVIAAALAPVRYDRSVAVKTLRPAVARISSGYQLWGSQLPPEAQNAWHTVKGITGSIQLILDDRGYDEAAKTPDAERLNARLQALRATLTEQQLLLAEARQALRETHFRRIAEFL